MNDSQSTQQLLSWAQEPSGQRDELKNFKKRIDLNSLLASLSFNRKV
jgi:hypothetical protein